jgi:5-methylcytosine-specific restriction protein A
MARYSQGLCNCGNLQTSAGRYKGRQIFHRYCNQCKQNKKRNYIKESSCEMCGFVAVIPQQLDIDHIDGNHSNEDPGNLQTLCANCHRFKTYINKDHISKKIFY